MEIKNNENIDLYSSYGASLVAHTFRLETFIRQLLCVSAPLDTKNGKTLRLCTYSLGAQYSVESDHCIKHKT